ncbi:MAG: polysaccharide pyruvyl transferase family protein [Pseudomonadota bacterium]
MLTELRHRAELKLLPLAAPWVRRARRDQAMRDVLLAMPPAGKGSLGDQAILQGLIDGLASIAPHITVQQLMRQDWKPTETAEPSAYEPVVMGRNPERFSHFMHALGTARGFGVLGADVMDGKYGDLISLRLMSVANLAAAAGTPSALMGFSLSGQSSEATCQAFRSLHRNVAVRNRDCVSQERFNTITSTKRSELSADLAFLMQPRLRSEPAKDAAAFIENARAGGHTILGFNGNSLNVEPDERPAYTERLAFLLTTLLDERPNISVVMIPHDLRKHHSDLETAETVFAQMPEQLQKRITILRPPIDAWDVKAVAGLCDFVFAGRMHLAIASLGSGVPVACTVYAGKFEGLFHHFHLPSDGLITPEDVMQAPQNAAQRLARLLDDRERTAQLVSSQLGSVKEQARRNIQAALPDITSTKAA